MYGEAGVNKWNW